MRPWESVCGASYGTRRRRLRSHGPAAGSMNRSGLGFRATLRCPGAGRRSCGCRAHAARPGQWRGGRAPSSPGLRGIGLRSPRRAMTRRRAVTPGKLHRAIPDEMAPRGITQGPRSSGEHRSRSESSSSFPGRRSPLAIASERMLLPRPPESSRRMTRRRKAVALRSKPDGDASGLSVRGGDPAGGCRTRSAARGRILLKPTSSAPAVRSSGRGDAEDSSQGPGTATKPAVLHRSALPPTLEALDTGAKPPNRRGRRVPRSVTPYPAGPPVIS
jgi:hypothetical protein